ncbi:hypothetical protein BH24ACT3_BH24ACT3_19500 [soil metagenome]
MGRDAAEIRCAVNLGWARDEVGLGTQFGEIAEMVRPGVLIGGAGELRDRIEAYRDAGVDQINIAVRAPWDHGDLDRLAEVLAELGDGDGAAA